MKIQFSAPKQLKLNAKAIDYAKLVKIAGQELAATIKRLRSSAKKGVGADGQPIRASGYAPAYIDAMKKGKVKNRGVRKPYSETVNLTISGHLFNTVQIQEVSGENAQKMFFNDTETNKIANGLFARGFSGWFEFGKADIERLEKRFAKEIEKMMANLIK